MQDHLPLPPHPDDEDQLQVDENGAPVLPAPRNWIVLQNAHEVETWIDNYNRELQAIVYRHQLNTFNAGQGICFTLELGGEVYLHTTSEGQVLLDVSEEAAWVAPVVSAATKVAPPAGTVWVLPHDTLTQLILGLSGMIATSQFVLQHEYKLGQGKRIQF